MTNIYPATSSRTTKSATKNSKELFIAANGAPRGQASYSCRLFALFSTETLTQAHKIFYDSLRPLEQDPLCGMVSPPLMGSCGVNPLTIIGPLPDVCRHMSNCIARAKKEIFLATNYWMNSDASKLITDSLHELSRRAGERGEKAVVKIMYDRGNPKQVFYNHQYVPESEFTGGAVNLPPLKDLPNLELEVVNFHRPILGTFHAKFMVVDRRIAIISSNNIQDNDNLEMMTHLEGPIVDSFYELSLLSWHNAMKPPLPQINSPASGDTIPCFQQASHNTMFNENGLLRDLTGEPLPKIGAVEDQQPNDYVTSFAGLADKNPNNILEGGNLSSVVKIGNRERLTEHKGGDPHYDPDIAAEVKRAQSVLSPKESESRMQAVTRHLSKPAS